MPSKKKTPRTKKRPSSRTAGTAGTATKRTKPRKASPKSFTVGRLRVLALDSSSKACGWSIFDSGMLAGHGVYIQEGKGHGERLSNFRKWLLKMLKKWGPDRVVYEAPYQSRMRNTFAVLSKYVGIIEAAHFEHFSREFERGDAVPAHVVKLQIGAKKGRNHEANKKIVVTLVNETFGLRLKFKPNDTKKQVSQDDEADAIAVNWAWHLLNERKADTEAE